MLDRRKQMKKESSARYHVKHGDRIRAKKRETQKEYRRLFPEKVAASWRKWYKSTRTSGRWRLTGFTADLFEAAVQAQNGKCAICQVDLASLEERYRHADHDHATGTPRGVLCGSCNNGLGNFKDNPDFLKAAIAYLHSPTLPG